MLLPICAHKGSGYSGASVEDKGCTKQTPDVIGTPWEELIAWSSRDDKWMNHTWFGCIE